jgi:hypothetical protein
MQKINLLVIAFLAMFAVSAYSQDKFTDPTPNYAQDGTTVLFYTQVKQEATGKVRKHILRFVRNKDCKDVIYVQHVKCNDSPLEGWTKLGPGSAQSWQFTYNDDQDNGSWTWEYSVIKKTAKAPSPNADTLFQ